jgi:hypothetical protein
MELNTKMFIKELMKEARGELQSMRDGFTAHESAFNMHITKLSMAT